MKENDIDFPVGTASFNVTIQHKEMTLRDYFAAKVMQSVYADSRYKSHEHIASVSYAMANAMMKARKE